MAEFASRATGGTALGLSIGALGAQALSGGLGNLLGGFGGWGRQGVVPVCGDDMPVTRYDIGLIKENTELRTEVKLRDANFYALSEIGKVRDELNAFKNEQVGYNATNTATVGCIGQQVQGIQAVLNSITQIKVPNEAVCPGWGPVRVVLDTTTAAAAATTPTT